MCDWWTRRVVLDGGRHGDAADRRRAVRPAGLVHRGRLPGAVRHRQALVLLRHQVILVRRGRHAGMYLKRISCLNRISKSAEFRSQIHLDPTVYFGRSKNRIFKLFIRDIQSGSTACDYEIQLISIVQSKQPQDWSLFYRVASPPSTSPGTAGTGASPRSSWSPAAPRASATRRWWRPSRSTFLSASLCSICQRY